MSITREDLKVVYKATFGARNEWQNILLELGVSSTTIYSIEISRQGNPTHCFRDGLSEWLTGGVRSWRDLVEALSSPTVGRNDIAMTIERNYIQSASVTSEKQTCEYMVICIMYRTYTIRQYACNCTSSVSILTLVLSEN